MSDAEARFERRMAEQDAYHDAVADNNAAYRPQFLALLAQLTALHGEYVRDMPEGFDDEDDAMREFLAEGERTRKEMGA